MLTSCILLQLLKSESQQVKRERDELEQASMASSDSVSEVSVYFDTRCSAVHV